MQKRGTENLKHIDRWFPTQQQVGSPGELERAFRQVLEQHYALTQRVQELEAKQAQSMQSNVVGGQGPADTKLLGLNVEPADVQTLADGSTLKFNKSRGTFSFQ